MAQNGMIAEYDQTGAQVGGYGTNGPVQGLATDGPDLFAPILDGGSVTEYSSIYTSGRVILVGLSGPNGIAYSGGEIYVTNSNGNIYADPVPAFGTTNVNAAGPFISNDASNDPVALVASGSFLYVLNGTAGGSPGDSSIAEYSLSTGTLMNATLVTGLASPVSFALSGSTFYITETGNSSKVVTAPLTGGSATTLILVAPGGAGATQTPNLTTPTGIAVLGPDFYISDTASGTVQEYTTAGAPSNTAFAVNNQFAGGLNDPYGIVLAAPEPNPAWMVILGIGLFAWIWSRSPSSRAG